MKVLLVVLVAVILGRLFPNDREAIADTIATNDQPVWAAPEAWAASDRRAGRPRSMKKAPGAEAPGAFELHDRAVDGYFLPAFQVARIFM
jgi:hypothetical protein